MSICIICICICMSVYSILTRHQLPALPQCYRHRLLHELTDHPSCPPCAQRQQRRGHEGHGHHEDQRHEAQDRFAWLQPGVQEDLGRGVEPATQQAHGDGVWCFN